MYIFRYKYNHFYILYVFTFTHIHTYYIYIYTHVYIYVYVYTYVYTPIYKYHPKATPSYQLPWLSVPPPSASSDWTTSSPNVGPRRVSLGARGAEPATGTS